MVSVQASVSTIYRLTDTQFKTLFDKKIDPALLERLCQSAAQGYQECIDLLHNIALRGDDSGKLAEQMLFDLFSGKSAGKPGVDQLVQEASLKLYTTASNNESVNRGNLLGGTKITQRPKLLYMAGSAMQNVSQRAEIAQLIAPHHIAQSPHEQVGPDNLWSTSRLVSSDELSQVVSDLESDQERISFNAPIGMLLPDSKENLLLQIVFEKMEQPGWLSKPEYFPLNTGNHWVLFGLYRDYADNDQIKAVLFNSKPAALSAKDLGILEDIATLAGQRDDAKFTYIAQDLQDNVPNGCALFVAEAMKQVASTIEHKPEQQLRDFSQGFAARSSEEQVQFNIDQRRQMLGRLLDGLR